MLKWIEIKDMGKFPPLPDNRPLLCFCPEWSDNGYQVAFYNGKEFYFAEQPNDMFDGTVEKYALFMEAD